MGRGKRARVLAMSGGQLNGVLQFLRQIASPGPEREGTDGQLLECFVARRDEAAFTELIRRHGPLVWGVCRRMLPQAADAEDAFQATFLVLVRRAAAVRRRESARSWLYGVAYRVAGRARRRSARRQVRERPLPDAPLPGRCSPDVPWQDVRAVLDDEVSRLAEKYRQPFLLCYLEGKTFAEAARLLGYPLGTISTRLARAREILRVRLTRRGLTLSAGALAALLAENTAAAAVPPALLEVALNIGLSGAARPAAAGGVLSAQVVALGDSVMRAMWLARLRTVLAVVLVLGLLGTGTRLLPSRGSADQPAPEATPQLIPGASSSVRLSATQAARLGIRIEEAKARDATQLPPLRNPGALALDPDRLARVRARFPGEVIEIGSSREGADRRPLAAGARVRQGEVLAVLWSKELGQKKGELVDALVKLLLDEPVLASLEDASKQGTVPQASVLQARRDVETDRIAVARAERALRLGRLSPEEIRAVRQEAEHIAARAGQRDPAKEDGWARLEIRAPFAGRILEKKVTVGDLVDSATDLFTVADQSRLAVQVEVPELEMVAFVNPFSSELRRLKLKVRFGASSVVEGTVTSVSPVINRTNGTAQVTGVVDNADGDLLAGQFVTVELIFPRQAEEVTVPARALVEENGETFVFVQPDPKQTLYAQRRVVVVRRGPDEVHVRARLSPEQERRGLQPIYPDERVVTAGAIELKATLERTAPRK